MDKGEIEALWRAFRAGGDPALRNSLVEHYLPLVRRVAERTHFHLARRVEIDELFSAGLLGLLESVGRYVPSRQVLFETFATPRIRGAMLDAVRGQDWAPRLARSARQAYQQAFSALRQELSRQPDDEEMMARLGLDAEAYHRLCLEANIPVIASIPELSRRGDRDDGPEDWVADERTTREDRRRDLREFLEQLLETLPERERQILAMYFHEEMTLKEIGAVLGITEGRVSQILSALLCRLRERHGEEARSYR